jgi:hypothetical protein
MKRLIFTFCIALFSMTSLFAQEDILIDDFESGVVSFTTEVHVNPAASMDITVVTNPVKAGINLSDKVWEWKRYDATPDPNQSWAGFWAILTTEIPSGYNRIEVKYLRKNSTSQLRMKVEGTINKEFNPITPASKTNEWETMVFDLTANGIKNIKVLSLFPDYYTPVDPASVCYIDDIKVIYDPEVVIPTTPAIQVLFDNSASDRFHDQSWVNQTAPSTVATENWDAASSDPGDKLPVVTSPVKAGANALKLQWKSVETGDWKALVAAIGWTPFDLTEVTKIKFWVNSPVALSKNALPKIYLEAFSGSPNVTGSIFLDKYLPNGLSADTWTEVVIPAEDLWAVDQTFSSKDVIKGIFFMQSATDNVEHTLYLDEFTFVNTTTGLDVQNTGKVLSSYYNNGEIRISNFSGNVKVFDLVGRKVAEGYTYNGNLKVNLKKGIYIVNTKQGNAKIALQ